MQRIYSTTIKGVSVLVIAAGAANESDKVVPLYAEPVATTVPTTDANPAPTGTKEKLPPQIRSTPISTEDDQTARQREVERLKQQYRGTIKDGSIE